MSTRGSSISVTRKKGAFVGKRVTFPQTIQIGDLITLVDCPGLVFPNFMVYSLHSFAFTPTLRAPPPTVSRRRHRRLTWSSTDCCPSINCVTTSPPRVSYASTLFIGLQETFRLFNSSPICHSLRSSRFRCAGGYPNRYWSACMASSSRRLRNTRSATLSLSLSLIASHAFITCTRIPIVCPTQRNFSLLMPVSLCSVCYVCYGMISTTVSRAQAGAC
jgi:hypothetical protein